MTKLIAAFRNFANALKNSCLVIRPCFQNHYYRHLSEPRIIFSNMILTLDFVYLLVSCSFREYCRTVQIWQKRFLRCLCAVRNRTVPWVSVLPDLREFNDVQSSWSCGDDLPAVAMYVTWADIQTKLLCSLLPILC